MQVYALFKKPLFWLMFIASAIFFSFITVHYFPKAFPIVTIDLKMDRGQALEKAKLLAAQEGWGPRDYQQATQFHTDTIVKTFVELEGGGKQAFTDMMQKGLYEPYVWHVRHFKEFEKNETSMLFTPVGKPYGFIETISEDKPGAALETDDAQKIAEQTTAEKWEINFAEYKKIEASKEVRPSKRVDHIFVYERPDIRIGQGYYRLRIVVSGDTVTALNHFVHVPEEFLLRYKEMRSANESIASAAQMFTTLFYLIIGCMLGLIFLLRRRWLMWRPALLWAIGIALLQFLSELNELPLVWTGYYTAFSAHTFLSQHLLSALRAFIMSTLTFSITFLAAEGLTRKAFGHQLQLWQVWSPRLSRSVQVAWQTIGGYLLVPFDFALSVIFYLATTRLLGWWTPLDELINPNILATYLPGLQPIADSLMAGFREECFFRAIPLAGAALLGRRLGKEKLFIGIAFVLQAIVFGAAHANYPAQPAIARLVELIIPSFVFGALYLVFGLLPAIVMHFVIDVVWMSIPIFVATAPSVLPHKIFVILAAGIPLWIIIRSRLRGPWTKASESDLNHSWQPPTQEEKPIIEEQPQQIISKAASTYTIAVTMVFGLFSWLFFTKFNQDAPPLTISRNDVEQVAKQVLEKKNDVSLATPWYPLNRVFGTIVVSSDSEIQHRFIWQKGGKQLYQRYLGTYLTPPCWFTRFVKFDGEVSERAEEYQTMIGYNGAVVRTTHQLPETASGVSLEEEDARATAHETLQSHYQLDPKRVKEVSAIASKKPARKDWGFIFSNGDDYPLEQGEARIVIEIAGNEVVETYRYIHVPEQWERTEENKITLTELIASQCNFLIYLLFLLGIFVSLKIPRRTRLSIRTIIIIFASFVGIHLIALINNWPTIIASFNTSEPFYNQLFMLVGSTIVRLLLRALLFSSVIAAALTWRTPQRMVKSPRTIALGLSIGFFVSGLIALVHNLVDPSIEPLWAEYDNLGAVMPIGAMISAHIMDLVALTVFLLSLFSIIHHLTKGWQTKRLIGYSILLITGLALIGMQSIDTVTSWIIVGLTTGAGLTLAYHSFVRRDHALIPLSVGAYVVSQLAQKAAFGAFPGVTLGAIISSIIVFATSLIWFNHLNRDE